MREFEFEKPNYYDMRIKPHLTMLAEELKTVTSKLPRGNTFDVDIISVVKQKPVSSIRTVRALLLHICVDAVPPIHVFRPEPAAFHISVMRTRKQVESGLLSMLSLLRLASNTFLFVVRPVLS